MLISSAFELMQRPITLTNTLPFCAAVGGMLGALWDYMRNPKAGFQQPLPCAGRCLAHCSQFA